MDKSPDDDELITFEYGPPPKAKPTTYNGVHFRSRLEARWAIYMDLMGIHWNYEPRSFGRGIWYVPDFFLPDYQTWAEVKPFALSRREQASTVLVASYTKQDFLHLAGEPSINPINRLKGKSCTLGVDDKVIEEYDCVYLVNRADGCLSLDPVPDPEQMCRAVRESNAYRF